MTLKFKGALLKTHIFISGNFQEPLFILNITNKMAVLHLNNTLTSKIRQCSTTLALIAPSFSATSKSSRQYLSLNVLPLISSVVPKLCICHRFEMHFEDVTFLIHKMQLLFAIKSANLLTLQKNVIEQKSLRIC